MYPIIEFWFDFSCPYAYLGSCLVEALAERAGAKLEIRPMLLGGVFRARAVPQNLAGSLSPAKARHNANDLRRYAALCDVPLVFPPNHPIRTVDALRCVLAVGEPFAPLMHAFFRAYWVDGVDISTDSGLKAVLTAAGHDAGLVIERARMQLVKDDLRERTDEAIGKGIFGAPGLVVDGALYWGQDRFDMVEAVLTGHWPELDRRSSPAVEPACPVDFFFDYSSPYSYIAANRVEDVLGDAARWRPMLLGGVWKANNPASLELSSNPVKNAYLGADYRRQGAQVGLLNRWPSIFPMRTMVPLRVTLLAGSPPDLIRALFAAYWADDRDISDPAVVAEVTTAAGYDGAGLVEAASTPSGKEVLRVATQAAIDAGVFGAPTFVVHPADVPEGAEPALFWGNDRLHLAARAARGDRSLL